MGSVAKRPDGRWRARYRDAEGREHAKHFARKVDAQAWLADESTARRAGTWVDPSTLLADEASTWLDAHPDWAASTRARNEGIVSRHILPRWGAVPMSAVTAEAIQEWVSHLSANVSPASVRKIIGVLSGILDTAIRMGRLTDNPCHRVSLPRAAMARRRYLSIEQVEALADAAGPEHALIVRVLAYCGLRWGEMAALRGASVDLGRRRLRVEESVTDVGGHLVFSEPKTHQRRSVPWPDFLDAEFVALVALRRDDELLFHSSTGSPLRVGNARRSWWDRACENAGIGALTPHELRHTAASLAVSAGASVLAVQRMLGHAKPSMTLDVYADLFDQDLDMVSEALSRSRADFLRTKPISTDPA